MLCAHLYLLLSHTLGVSLLPSACSNPLCRHPPLPPRRSPLVLRLFALALADGSGLPFSLYPPPAALESQTPQREARRLPPQATELQECEPQLSPQGAGCPHPSRCSAKAPRRATFPKGKAKRFAGVGFEFILTQTVLLQRRPGRRAGGRPPVRPRR